MTTLSRRSLFARLAGLAVAPVAAKLMEPRGSLMSSTPAGTKGLDQFLNAMGPLVEAGEASIDKEALAREFYRAAGPLTVREIRYMQKKNDLYRSHGMPGPYDYIDVTRDPNGTISWRKTQPSESFLSLCHRGVL